jgi:DNA-binding protein H-NS
MATLEQLLAQQAALARQIQEAQSESRTLAIADIRRLLTEHGLTLADVAATPSKRVKSGGSERGGKKVAPKYRDPSTGQTWSGRGLKPKWLAQAVTDGKSIDMFLI